MQLDKSLGYSLIYLYSIVSFPNDIVSISLSISDIIKKFIFSISYFYCGVKFNLKNNLAYSINYAKSILYFYF